jgi:hypothetical protein
VKIEEKMVGCEGSVAPWGRLFWGMASLIGFRLNYYLSNLQEHTFVFCFHKGYQREIYSFS